MYHNPSPSAITPTGKEKPPSLTQHIGETTAPNTAQPANYSPKELRVIQANLNHCTAATVYAAAYAAQNNIDVLLLQDPHVNEGRLSGFPLAWQSTRSEDFRAWVVVTTPAAIFSPHCPTSTSAFATLQTATGPFTFGTPERNGKNSFTASSVNG